MFSVFNAEQRCARTSKEGKSLLRRKTKRERKSAADKTTNEHKFILHYDEKTKKMFYCRSPAFRCFKEKFYVLQDRVAL
jgi:hypothetical protein